MYLRGFDYKGFEWLFLGVGVSAHKFYELYPQHRMKGWEFIEFFEDGLRERDKFIELE